MPRAKYRIRTEEDYESAKRWLVKKFEQVGWPNVEDARKAQARFMLVETPESLQAWCDRYLTAQQWKRIRDYIRAARRNSDDYKSIKISANAWQILSDIAERDTLTYSDIIEKHLVPIRDAETTPDAPLMAARSSARNTDSKQLRYHKKDDHTWEIEVQGDVIGTVSHSRRGFWIAEAQGKVFPGGSRQAATRELILKLDIQSQYQVDITNL